MSKNTEGDKSHLNLYQKLAAIGGEIGVVKKGGKNTEQHYDFIEYAAVAGKLRSLFADYGIVIIPGMPKAAEHIRQEITTKYGTKGVLTMVDMTFEIINADDPSERFEVTWVGEAADYGDKATNKAATAALKYYMMRQFNISEKGDDPDAESPEVSSTTRAAAKQPTNGPMTDRQRAMIFALMRQQGIEDSNEQKAIYHLNIGVPEGTEVTAQHASAFIKKLQDKTFKRPEPSSEPEPAVDDTPPENPDEVITDIDEDKPVTLDNVDVVTEDGQTFLATDEIKEEIEEKIKTLGLTPMGRMRLLKETTKNRVSLQRCDDDDWMKLQARVEKILDGTEELPEEWFDTNTPKQSDSKLTGDQTDGTNDTESN